MRIFGPGLITPPVRKSNISDKHRLDQMDECGGDDRGDDPTGISTVKMALTSFTNQNFVVCPLSTGFIESPPKFS